MDAPAPRTVAKAVAELLAAWPGILESENPVREVARHVGHLEVLTELERPPENVEPKGAM